MWTWTPAGDEAQRLAERVGAPLRAAREHARLTFAELGRRSGVDPGTISKYERGLSRPRRVYLQKIADGLMPLDPAGAVAFAEQLAAAAGSSLVGDVTMPVSVAREMVVAIIYRSMLELGMDPEDERVRTVVVRQIREVAGDELTQPAIGAGR